jgi:signal transduction histidine kinase
LLKRAGLRCDLDVTAVSSGAKVNAELRHQLFLTFKEALNNVITHARATEVRIRLWVEDDRLTILVEDNGRGFEERGGQGSSDGLRNMRERLAHIGGGCEIESVLGCGTTVTFTLPMKIK